MWCLSVESKCRQHHCLTYIYNLPYKGTNTLKHSVIVQELCESRGVRPNEPSGFRGRKELLNRASALVTTCP